MRKVFSNPDLLVGLRTFDLKRLKDRLRLYQPSRRCTLLIVPIDDLTEAICKWGDQLYKQYKNISAKTPIWQWQGLYILLSSQWSDYEKFAEIQEKIVCLRKLFGYVDNMTYTYRNCQIPLDHLSELMKIKHHELQEKKELHAQLDIIEKKERDLEKRGYASAAASARKLHQDLKVKTQQYYTQPYFKRQAYLPAYKVECAQAIHEANKVLSKHRGWRHVFAEIGLVLASLVVFYPVVMGVNKYHHDRYTVFGTTNSSKQIAETHSVIQQMNHVLPHAR